MENKSFLNSSEVPLLLLGFTRLDFLQKRILEISRMPVKILYLSIDGGGSISSEEMHNFISWSKNLLPQLSKFVIELKPENLGLVNHITSAISNVLSQHSHVVIVEDDIEMSESFFENIIDGFNKQLESHSTGIVGAFSVLNLQGIILGRYKNRWRFSNYASIWGWGCTSEIWDKYCKDLDYESCLSKLKESKSWSKLTKYQQAVWLGRFRKAINNPDRTWDIQLQYLSFAEDYKNMYPTFSLTRNEGFNNSRSSNTKGKKPLWMSSNLPHSGYIVSKSSSKFINYILQTIDANLLAGDTKLIFYWKHKLKLRLPSRH
jgi:hypothetical protein